MGLARRDHIEFEGAPFLACSLREKGFLIRNSEPRRPSKLRSAEIFFVERGVKIPTLRRKKRDVRMGHPRSVFTIATKS